MLSWLVNRCRIMAKRIPAGNMRHRVKIQTNDGEGTYDSYGQETATWSTTDEVRAAIEPLRGREAEYARQLYATATTKVTVDYLEVLNSTGATRRRVLFGSRALNIGSVVNVDEEGFVLELLCGEEK